MQFGADRHAVLARLTCHHPGHFDDDLVDCDQLPFGSGLSVQRSQAVDNPRGKSARFHDFFRPFERLIHIGRITLEPSQRCPGMSGSDLNWLCEFVRDGSYHFSHRADPACMGEIGLELLGALAVFNVVVATAHHLTILPRLSRRGWARVWNQR